MFMCVHTIHVYSNELEKHFSVHMNIVNVCTAAVVIVAAVILVFIVALEEAIIIKLSTINIGTRKKNLMKNCLSINLLVIMILKGIGSKVFHWRRNCDDDHDLLDYK